MKRVLVVLLLAGSLLGGAGALPAADAPAFTRQEVIYGRKYGTALTMDVFRPAKAANGAGIIFAMSGGWYSTHEAITDATAKPYLDRGYTVFAVVHGSNPKYAIPEILDDMNRAVRFIRHNAKEYGIDPDRLGITGGSAGGHLSLMQGCAGGPGDPKAKDPIDRESSRVAAVACFFPPTDFLNWGERGKAVRGEFPPLHLKGAFDFRTFDPKTGGLEPVTDEGKVMETLKKISPIYHVSKDSPPTLIVHGDEDPLVPVQQARAMVGRLKEAGVPAELIVKKGGKHDGALVMEFRGKTLDWFDKYLAKKEAPPGDK
jgi:acetyl esterase/lipase